MTWQTRDKHADLSALPVTAAQTAVTAGGAGDATEVDGLSVDLSTFTDSQQSVTLLVTGVTTLAAAETLSIAANWQEADDTGFSAGVQDVPDAATLANTVVATGAVTAGTFYARLELNLQHVSKQFIRAQFTPDISTGSVDTATIIAVYLIAGGQAVPAASTS